MIQLTPRQMEDDKNNLQFSEMQSTLVINY